MWTEITSLILIRAAGGTHTLIIREYYNVLLAKYFQFDLVFQVTAVIKIKSFFNKNISIATVEMRCWIALPGNVLC